MPAALSYCVLLATVLITLADDGIQVGIPGIYDIIMPTSIAQCEPVVIYYNSRGLEPYIDFWTPDYKAVFMHLQFSNDEGYLDWICNIPAGESFIIVSYVSQVPGPLGQFYTVGPGSSACLGPVTTAYPNAYYNTPQFSQYTAGTASYANVSYYSTFFRITDIGFPTNSLSTITVNTDLAASITATASANSGSTTSATLASSRPRPSSSQPTSSPLGSSRKSNKASVAGGIVGGLIFLSIALVAIFLLLRKLRKFQSTADAAGEPSSEPVPDPELASNQPGPSVPLLGALTYPSLRLNKQSPVGEGQSPRTNSTGKMRRKLLLPSPNARTNWNEPILSADPFPVPIEHRGVIPLPGPYDIAGEAPLPPVPPKQVPTISTESPPGQSRHETRDPQSNLAAALNVISHARLSDSQRQALIASLGNPADIVVPLPTQSDPAGVRHSQSELAAALELVLSRVPLTTSQRQALLVASLDASSNASPPIIQAAPHEGQDNIPDLANIQTAISGSNPRDGYAFMSSLNESQLTTANLARADTVSLPPPYS